MVPEEITNELLQLHHIPAADTSFETVVQFGYTFHGFKLKSPPNKALKRTGFVRRLT